ncbi:MAG: peptidoglycan editing factor PgeF [Anaerolineae bacterium]
MIRVETANVPYRQFACFPEGHVVHGVFTRVGGVSASPFATLNVGRTVGDDPAAVDENLARVCAALGFVPTEVVTGQQVHADRVAAVGRDEAGQVLPATDALLTDAPGVALLLRFADCVPVLFHDAERGVVGITHAGWQGTAQRIAAKTAQAMMARYGCRPESLQAAIGPSIGPCCFEVGPEVVEAIRASVPEAAWGGVLHEEAERPHVDLWQANVCQLQEMGLQRIEVAGLCTQCHRDAFYSHRGEGGRTGRFAALIALR